MTENPNDVPRWVHAVLGQQPSRQSAVFLLLVAEAFTLLAALVPFITLIGSLLDGWRTTWSMSATVLLFLVAALAAYDIWVWRAIRWMDRHGMWPAQPAPTV